MRKTFRESAANLAGCVALIALAGGAHASFHLYLISQIYSDASGNVQYIEFAAPVGADGQQFLTGAHLDTASGGNTHTFTFLSNLPATMAHPTGNTKFLVGTQGFANLGLLTPDYIVPDKFLFIPGGSITYGTFYDMVSYPALPTSGNQAIDRLGATVQATPTNFAGNTAMINVLPPIPAGVYDIDANGQLDPLTDGLLLMRYMFGLRGAALTQGAVGPSAARNTPEAIEAHIASQIPP